MRAFPDALPYKKFKHYHILLIQVPVSKFKSMVTLNTFGLKSMLFLQNKRLKLGISLVCNANKQCWRKWTAKYKTQFRKFQACTSPSRLVRRQRRHSFDSDVRQLVYCCPNNKDHDFHRVSSHKTLTLTTQLQRFTSTVKKFLNLRPHRLYSSQIHYFYWNV